MALSYFPSSNITTAVPFCVIAESLKYKLCIVIYPYYFVFSLAEEKHFLWVYFEHTVDYGYLHHKT